MFGVCSLYIWNMGNVFLFYQKFIKVPNLAIVVRQHVELLVNVIAGIQNFHSIREWRLICWRFPPNGWMKLNTDVSFNLVTNNITAGVGYVRKMMLGLQDSALILVLAQHFFAEVWGLYVGLHVCWQKGLMQVRVEPDNQVVVNFMQSDILIVNSTFSMIWDIEGLIHRDWEFKLIHTCKEGGNRATNALANYVY